MQTGLKPGMSDSEKSKPYDQRLAGFLIKPFKNTLLHPNHITTITLLLGVASALIFAVAIEMAWLAALLYMLAVFTDHMDGELARITGKSSKFGHNYDYIVGGLNYMMLFIGIGIGLHAEYGEWALILGLVAGLSNPLILYLRMAMEVQHGFEAVEHPQFISGFQDEDFIYLIGPITWFVGIIWFFVPYALGNIGYLVWTIKERREWKKKENTEEVIEEKISD